MNLDNFFSKAIKFIDLHYSQKSVLNIFYNEVLAQIETFNELPIEPG